MKSCLPLVLLVIVAVVSGCDKNVPPTTSNAIVESAPKVFEARGVVRSVPEGGQTIVVRHEEIPGYMPKMTMELNVRDAQEIAGLKRNDEIAFQLVATTNTHWIQNIKRLGKVVETEPEPPSPGFTVTKELAPGDALPDYEFLAEDGRKIKFSDFRGRVLAFTFIFSRCPLPDFCPRMGNNFAAARELIATNAAASTNWQFLSISFDPEFDSPEVLHNYAKNYRHENPDRWLFVAAPPAVLRTLAPELNLLLTRESGSISHNLRTVVIDPKGNVFKQFDGNRWTPEELAAAILAAARPN